MMLTADHWVGDQMRALREKPIYLLSFDQQVSEPVRQQFESDLANAAFIRSLRYISPDDQLDEMAEWYDLDESFQDLDHYPTDSVSIRSLENSLQLPHLFEFRLKGEYYESKDSILDHLSEQDHVIDLQVPIDGDVLPISYSQLMTWSAPTYRIVSALLIFLLLIGHVLISILIHRSKKELESSSNASPFLTFQWVLVVIILFACHTWLFRSTSLINFIYLPVIPIVGYGLLYTIYFLLKAKRSDTKNS